MKMKIDFKFVFLILAVLCQLYYVDGWWGGGSRSSRGSGSYSGRTSVRTPSRRGRWWSSSRRPSVRTPSVRKPSYRRPSVRRPSVSRRSGWWSRGRRPSVRTPSVRKPSVRKPSVRVPSPRPKPQRNSGSGSLQVSRGQVTFDSEGNDKPRSIYFSREPHVPSSASGITIGRGYDLKKRKASEVYRDLLRAGIPTTTSKKISGGVRLGGQKAKNYLKKNNLQSYKITRGQQKKLFYIAYDKIAADAKRLATKADVQRKYGKTDWAKLNSAIKDVVVDLRYRGDYTPKTRRKIQSVIAANNLKSFTQVMSDKKFWLKQIKVPKDRFLRRKNALIKAG